MAAVLVQVNVTEPVPVFEVHVGVVVSNEAIPGNVVGELTGDGVTTGLVGVGFGVGFGVDLAGGAVVFGAAFAGDGVAVTVTVAVAVTTVADDAAGAVADVAATAGADTVEGLDTAPVGGAAEEADAGLLDGVIAAGAAWCEPDEQADSRTVIDALATNTRR